MAYTARQLITRSLYLSGMVSRDLQTPTGAQITEGLDLLNDLLAVKSIDQGLVPYFKEYSLISVPGQEKYFVPNLIEIESVTFNIQSVRFPIVRQTRMQYYGTGRADNINSLPATWHVERVYGGSDLYLYFKPQQAWLVRIWGKFGLLSDIDLNEDLSIIYDRFYLTYLRYALADYICSDINITFQPQAAEKLKELEQAAKDISPYDMTSQKVSTFQKGAAISWGYVNFGRGWEA